MNVQNNIAELEKKLVANEKRMKDIQGVIKQKDAVIAEVRAQDSLKAKEIKKLSVRKKNVVTIKGVTYSISPDALVTAFNAMSRDFYGRVSSTQALPLLQAMLGIDKKEAQKILS